MRKFAGLTPTRCGLCKVAGTMLDGHKHTKRAKASAPLSTFARTLPQLPLQSDYPHGDNDDDVNRWG